MRENSIIWRNKTFSISMLYRHEFSMALIRKIALIWSKWWKLPKMALLIFYHFLNILRGFGFLWWTSQWTIQTSSVILYSWSLLTATLISQLWHKLFGVSILTDHIYDEYWRKATSIVANGRKNMWSFTISSCSCTHRSHLWWILKKSNQYCSQWPQKYVHVSGEFWP